jgi:hypothetical protein
MGGAAVVGPPPEDGEPPHEPVVQELTDPDEAKPAEEAPQGSDPARAGVLENPPAAMLSNRAPNSTDTGSPQGETNERIRLRAYEIWETEGRSGDAHDHWLRAEREIRGEIRTKPDQAAEGKFQPLSEDAAKMREQVNVAMNAQCAFEANQTGRCNGQKGSCRDHRSQEGEAARLQVNAKPAQRLSCGCDPETGDLQYSPLV